MRGKVGQVLRAVSNELQELLSCILDVVEVCCRTDFTTKQNHKAPKKHKWRLDLAFKLELLEHEVLQINHLLLAIGIALIVIR